jgi:hypothetical protein
MAAWDDGKLNDTPASYHAETATTVPAATATAPERKNDP